MWAEKIQINRKTTPTSSGLKNLILTRVVLPENKNIRFWRIFFCWDRDPDFHPKSTCRFARARRDDNLVYLISSKNSKVDFIVTLSDGNKIKFSPNSFFIGVKNSSAQDGVNTSTPVKSISTFSFLSLGNIYARALK
ncbi:MAG: hypothetical protein A2538_01580 [Candidatus Magasanikbacteria bacterium RIFOXYD2_FULL_41_14]|uniref:Uncharacterized protein n=1 Tax=Candidatus Magasanikbacteria bacterium RIFOXYD2_FULL_41_14 TaxID=1798709 RepID=A0A1F6PDZ6_9BACT|nr:MAG: hypothetical protein A2538_01580 [Candidatus Magasanikbacteria bacterium RIFOXYD2_FULL_41_14]